MKLDEVQQYPDRKKSDVRWTAVDEAVVKVIEKKSPFRSSRQTLDVEGIRRDRGSSRSLNEI